MKNQLSRFDIGMIIAFVVVLLIGVAGWWWLSGQLSETVTDTQQAASTFKKYSQSEVYLPNKQNVRTLQNNIDVMTAQLDPIVASRLQSAKSGLKGVHAIDTVDWKHDLDEEVSRLNAAAATHGVIVPKNFYYGFSRYLNTNPKEEATAVLKRQQIAVEAIANILIGAPVKAIVNIKRTAEEDSTQTGAGPGPAPVSSGMQPSDILPGHAIEAPGGVYTAYPLEFQFDTDTESFRTVMNQIMQSDYVFVVRSVMVQNSKLESPKLADLDTLAGVNTQSPPTASPSILTSPGAVAASAPAPTGNATIGLQYLFGDETLHVRVQLDLVDWHGIAQPAAPGPKGRLPANAHSPGARGTTHSPSPAPLTNPTTR